MYSQNNFDNKIYDFIEQSANTINDLKLEIDILKKMSNLICESIVTGNKVLTCGNGGSAADAQHFAAEMLIRFRSENDRRSLPALSLFQDPSTVTACGNDYSFDQIYSRLIESLGNRGDILFAISTSGESKNILQAIHTAQNKNIKIILLTGEKKKIINKKIDIIYHVKDINTAIIQQTHITIIHILMYMIEENLQNRRFI